MEDVEDNEFIASEHDRLINAVSKLDKTQHITEPTRNEPTSLNSEFHLLKRSNKLNLANVVKALGDTAYHVQIVKKLKKTQDVSKVLPKPLEKPQAQRIKRATGYEVAKKKIGRWDPVVARSRTVDFVTFPIKHVSNKLEPTKEFISKLTFKSPLEKELDAIDPSPVEEEKKEDEPQYPMSYDEMVEHRQHVAKLRAQESYKAAKAKRQSKIKSKKYHRILKKEKMKQQLKEFEELQKKNPEEALKKLEAIEKTRALERHTLRHKNTGKWAKSQLVRAKYDKEVRQQLAEQLSISKSLTQKVKDIESTDDEIETNECIPDIDLLQDPMNPWMMKRSNKPNVDAVFDFGYKKYIQGRKCESDAESVKTDDNKDTENINTDELAILRANVKKLIQNQNSEQIEETSDDLILKKYNNKLTSTSSWVVELINDSENDKLQEKPKIKTNELLSAFDLLENDVTGKIKTKLKNIRRNIARLEKRSKLSPKNLVQEYKEKSDNLEYLKLKNQKVKAVIDEELIETGTGNIETENKSISKIFDMLKTPEESMNSNIDPSSFIEVKPKYLKSVLPDGDTEFDQLDDDEQVVPKVNIEEVFEEDDIVASFRQEKEDEINEDKPENIDLSLPGWGSWGGKGVKAPKRKRNRFIFKVPAKVPRRDENKGDIIIKEFKNPKLVAHKVSDVPFPFTSVKEYEASIRAPLGNTFITAKAHKQLIRPNIITKAGTIIEPMDEEELLVPKNRKFGDESVIQLLGQK